MLLFLLLLLFLFLSLFFFPHSFPPLPCVKNCGSQRPLSMSFSFRWLWLTECGSARNANVNCSAVSQILQLHYLRGVCTG